MVLADFPKQYKFTVGQKLQDEVIEMVVLIYRANAAKETRAIEIEKFLEKLQVVELMIRLSQDMRILSKKHYAALIAMTQAERLNELFIEMNLYLDKHLGLEFHPFKKKIGLVRQGIDFVGYIHKPYRRYVRTRTLNKMKSVVHLWKKSSNGLSDYELKKFRATMNSYLGMIKWGATYKFRKTMGDKVSGIFIYPDESYQKLMSIGLEPVDSTNSFTDLQSSPK